MIHSWLCSFTGREYWHLPTPPAQLYPSLLFMAAAALSLPPCSFEPTKAFTISSSSKIPVTPFHQLSTPPLPHQMLYAGSRHNRSRCTTDSLRCHLPNLPLGA